MDDGRGVMIPVLNPDPESYFQLFAILHPFAAFWFRIQEKCGIARHRNRLLFWTSGSVKVGNHSTSRRRRTEYSICLFTPL